MDEQTRSARPLGVRCVRKTAKPTTVVAPNSPRHNHWLCTRRAGVKEGWRAAWATMVKELAPQSKSGAYKRQSYGFTGRIGDSQFPVSTKVSTPVRQSPNTPVSQRRPGVCVCVCLCVCVCCRLRVAGTMCTSATHAPGVTAYCSHSCCAAYAALAQTGGPT